MPQDYGIPAPEPHRHSPRRSPTRYLVLIESGSGRVARLFLADRTQVAELQAGDGDVVSMVRGIAATHNAGDAAWNDALRGHSDDERRAAEVYELER